LFVGKDHATLVAVAWSLPTNKQEFANHQEMVDFINSQKDSTWKAKVHPRFSQMTTEQLKALMGAKKRNTHPESHKFKIEPKFTGNADQIPKEFDARTKWPKCADVIGTIPDQSSCGSCWAVSSASVMSDRICIGTDGAVKKPVSANDLVSCCFSCGYGCQGGWPDETFYTWSNNGIVTGSGFKLHEGCSPYPFAECEHHIDKTTYPKCPKDIYKTPACQKSCQTSYKDKSYTNDKTYGKSAVFFNQDIAGIQNELLTNGPVVFTFDVYEDFVTYSSGVYKHTTGKYLGGHAVRCVGWGEEGGVPYWLIANSWNEDWGDKGYFKIIRGEDNCSIEEEISAARYKQ